MNIMKTLLSPEMAVSPRTTSCIAPQPDCHIRSTTHHFSPLSTTYVFILYQLRENSKVFFYFIFMILPKMQCFYAHFLPFLYQLCIKKEKTLFLQVFPFFCIFILVFYRFFLKNGLLPHQMISFFVSIPLRWYSPPQGTPKGAGKPEGPPPEEEADRYGVPRSRFFRSRIRSDT